MSQSKTAWDAGSRRALYQNLRDAGCPPQTARRCLALLEENSTQELRRQLALHRSRLLEELHQQQRKIDCLDFFLYRLERLAVPPHNKTGGSKL